MGHTTRMAGAGTVIALVAALVGASSGVLANSDWSLKYDRKHDRFTASKPDASICDRHGEGAVLNDEGDACWYAPTELTFLPVLGFAGDASGFTVSDPADDVRVFMESRFAQQQRFDARALDWAVIEADEDLLRGALAADGAVVGDAFDPTPGPRVALFVHLSEPPLWDGDTVSVNANVSADRDITNDMVRSLDPSFPNGGGDTNIAAGWSFIDDEAVRTPAVNRWSQAGMNLVPANVIAGPSEDPPGIWALYGAAGFSDRFNIVTVTQPLYEPMMIDRVEGAEGPFGSFELDGDTQRYLTGFSMDGTANVPGNDFQLVFHTPYAPLFQGGTATIGYLMGDQEDTFSKELETTADSVRLALSLPTGETGLTGIRLEPSPKAKVKVANRKKPVALKKWRKGTQLEEINAAVREIMALSLPTRFDLADGQEISLGAPPPEPGT